MYVYIYIYSCVLVYRHTYIYEYEYVYAYAYVYIHTHTHILPSHRGRERAADALAGWRCSRCILCCTCCSCCMQCWLALAGWRSSCCILCRSCCMLCCTWRISPITGVGRSSATASSSTCAHTSLQKKKTGTDTVYLMRRAQARLSVYLWAASTRTSRPQTLQARYTPAIRQWDAPLRDLPF